MSKTTNKVYMTRIQIKRWLRDKGRTRLKILFLLSQWEWWGITDLELELNRDHKNLWRTLKKLQIDGYTKNEKRKWGLTDRGINAVDNAINAGIIPIEKRAIEYN